MFHIVITSTAKTKLVTKARQSPKSFVEIDTTLMAARHQLSPTTLIAVVNDTYDIHLMRPARPGLPILALVDRTSSPARLCIVDFPTAQGMSSAKKKALAHFAADQINIYATDIFIP